MLLYIVDMGGDNLDLEPQERTLRLFLFGKLNLQKQCILLPFQT